MKLKQILAYFDKVELQIKGANLTYLLNEFARNNIPILFAQKVDDTTLCIKVRQNNLSSLIAILEKKCYNYTITHKKGLSYQISAGLLVGLLLCVVALCILSNFCLGVKINSQNQVLVEQVQKVLNNHNYGVGRTWGSLPFSEIEDTLRKEIEDLGLVNVTRKGAYLWVNFSNATLPSTIEQENTTGILSTTNGVISRLFVSSGTALVKVGDTVSLGQMLIAPYYIDEQEQQVPCVAKGAVFVYVWESATVEFCENTTEPSRTGNFVTGYNVVFQDNVLKSYQPNLTFENYEIETRKEYISNVLPLCMEYLTYYEVVDIPVHKNFKDEEQALIYEAKQKALQLVNENDILEEKHTVALVADKYYVTYYLKTEVQV